MRNAKSEMRNPKAACRRGLTLVELLVVIVLLLIVTAVAIPVLAPNNETRRIRESARMVSTFFSGARNRAIELGRPVCVQLERLSSNPNAAMVLSYMEVPQPYSGESLTSTCKIYRNDSTLDYEINVDPLGTGDFNAPLIRVGDVVKINYQGLSYRVRGPGTSATDPTVPAGTTVLIVDPISPIANPLLPWPSIDASDTNAVNALPRYPYQIIRQPVRSSDPPLQLPEGAVVDLRLSGEGGNWIHPDQAAVTPVANNPAIVFAPSGAVSAVYYFDDPDPSLGLPTARAPFSAVHFMIGRSDGVGTADGEFTDAKVPWNLRDMNNLWVSVGSQSGLVSTTENARVAAPVMTITGTTTPFDTSIAEARAIARSFQSMGGR